MNNITESVLVESRSARTSAISNFSDDRALELLNKAKALVMAVWQGTAIATNAQVAEFYEISEDVVRDNIRRNKEEFESDGLRVVKGKQLKDLLAIGSEKISQPKSTTILTLWTPRAAARLGMALRDSLVARQVRSTILDIVEAVNPQQVQIDPIDRDRQIGFKHLLLEYRDRLDRKERDLIDIQVKLFLEKKSDRTDRTIQEEMQDCRSMFDRWQAELSLKLLAEEIDLLRQTVGFLEYQIRSIDAQMLLKSFVPVVLPTLETRFALNQLVRGYAIGNGLEPENCWRIVHSAFRDLYHVDLVARGKNCKPKLSGCEFAQANGCIEELYAVAKSVLCNQSLASKPISHL